MPALHLYRSWPAVDHDGYGRLWGYQWAVVAELARRRTTDEIVARINSLRDRAVRLYEDGEDAAACDLDDQADQLCWVLRVK